MSLAAAIVPFGPHGYVARGRRFSGVFACLQCREFMRVEPDKAGVLNFYCDGTLHEAKCKLQLKGVEGRIPAGTAADLQTFRDDITAMRPEIRTALAASWGITINNLETIAHVQHSQEIPASPPQRHGGDSPAEGPTGPLPAVTAAAGHTGTGEPGKPAQSAGKPGLTAAGLDGTGPEFGPGTRDGGTGPGGGTSGGHWAGKFFRKP